MLNFALPAHLIRRKLFQSQLEFKSKCRVCCISSVQISDKDISDIKPYYYIGIGMNFVIIPILSENDESWEKNV